MDEPREATLFLLLIFGIALALMMAYLIAEWKNISGLGKGILIFLILLFGAMWIADAIAVFNHESAGFLAFGLEVCTRGQCRYGR